LGHQFRGVRLGGVELVSERQDRQIRDALAEAALLGDQKAADVVVEGRRGGPSRVGGEGGVIDDGASKLPEKPPCGMGAGNGRKGLGFRDQGIVDDVEAG
jgi:hypothetical protein